MDFFVWQRSIVNEAGDVLPLAEVTVTDVVSGGLAQLYSDAAGASPIGNPIDADANGFVQFYVKSGVYNVGAVLGGDSRTWSNEAIGAPYKRTPPETSAGIIPTSYQYPAGDVRRYGFSISANIATNTAAINAAVSQRGNGGGVITLPPGSYDIDAFTVSGLNNVAIEGAGDFANGTTLNYNGTSTTANVITFDTCQHSGLKNVYIRAKSTKRMTGGAAVRYTNSCFKCFADHVRVDYLYNGFDVVDSTETRLRNVQCRYILGTAGITFTGTVSIGSFRCTIDDYITDNPYPAAITGLFTWAATTAVVAGRVMVNSSTQIIYQCSTGGTTGSTQPSTIPGSGADDAFTATISDGSAVWKFVARSNLIWLLQDSYAYSLVVDKAALLNGGIGFRMTDGAATGTSYPVWAWLYDVECDHNYFNGVELHRGEGAYLDVWCGSCLAGNGLFIAELFRGEVNTEPGSRFMGNAQHGILCDCAGGSVIIDAPFAGANSQSSSGTYHGVTFGATAVDFQLRGGKCGNLPSGSNEQGYGVFITAGTDDFIIQGVNVRGNVTGGLLDNAGAVNKIVADNLS